MRLKKKLNRKCLDDQKAVTGNTIKGGTKICLIKRNEFYISNFFDPVIIISGILQKIIFGNQSMIFAMSCISLLGSVVWGHHMYTVGLETDTRAYFSGVTILISLPTGTKIFNWLSTYLGNPPLLLLKTNSPFFGLLFLLMFTIGGSTGIILGNAAVDLGLHDTYYVVAHFHFVLSLGAVIAIFSGIMFNGEKIVGSKNYLPSTSCTLSLYHLRIYQQDFTISQT